MTLTYSSIAAKRSFCLATATGSLGSTVISSHQVRTYPAPFSTTRAFFALPLALARECRLDYAAPFAERDPSGLAALRRGSLLSQPLRAARMQGARASLAMRCPRPCLQMVASRIEFAPIPRVRRAMRARVAALDGPPSSCWELARNFALCKHWWRVMWGPALGKAHVLGHPRVGRVQRCRRVAHSTQHAARSA